jgi:alkaline phosphatase isozyme conversion protein
MSDKDVENNLGGLTLQGIDDNAVGVGVCWSWPSG